MSLEIQKTEGILNKKVSTPAQTGSTSSNIDISLNKYQGKALDKAAEEQIRKLVAVVYPQVNWSELSDFEKQTYIQQYQTGSLQEKCQTVMTEGKKAVGEIIRSSKTPEEAVKNIADLHLSRVIDNYATLDETQKAEKRREMAINIVNKLIPILKENGIDLLKANHIDSKNITDIRQLPEEQLNELIDRQAFMMASIINAVQEGKIKEEDLEINKLKEICKTDEGKKQIFAALNDSQYLFAQEVKAQKPELFEDATFRNSKQGRIIIENLNKGDLAEKVAKFHGKTVEELRNDASPSKLYLEYLRSEKSTRELTTFEQQTLEILENISTRNNGDMTGVKTHGPGCTETSRLHRAFENDPTVDIYNLSDENKETLKQFILAELKNCKTDEERQECIKSIYASGGNEYETAIYNEIFAKIDAVEQPTFMMAAKAKEAIGCSTHDMDLQVRYAAPETQKAYTQHVADSKRTNTQKAGHLLHTIPEYHESARAASVNTMTDTGIQEVYDVLPETFSKLGDDAAKEAYQYVMTSDSISDEQKAVIAKDTIDMASDNDAMQAFYRSIAESNNVDYNSVPPKSERISSQNNNKQDEKIENTSYTKSEVTEILDNAAQPQGILATALNGVKETLEIILLGKTPDNSIKTEVASITSLNTAITQLKSGTKLPEVFKQSNSSTKQELVELICTYGKTAIAQLIETFGGHTIYKLAKTEESRALIKKELERIALSDATQRFELNEIIKTEQKNGLKTKG